MFEQAFKNIDDILAAVPEITMCDDTPPPGNANLPIGGMSEAPRTALPRGDDGAVTEAIQENGVPGVPGVPGNAVWHSRGYLPHFDNAEAIQHVTFHLADSLPREVVERLDMELKHLPLTKQDVERRKRVSAWLDAGHGCCVLREPEIASMVQDTFLFFDAQRYQLLEWVVMPNHVHVLFQPIHGWTVSKIVASWKKFTARKICDHWRSNGHPGNPILPNGGFGQGQQLEKQPRSGKGNPEAIQAAQPRSENGDPRHSALPSVWHREYWDRYIAAAKMVNLKTSNSFSHCGAKARMARSPGDRIPAKAPIVAVKCERFNFSICPIISVVIEVKAGTKTKGPRSGDTSRPLFDAGQSSRSNC